MNIAIFPLSILWLFFIQEITAPDTQFNQEVSDTNNKEQPFFDPLVLLYDAEINLLTDADITKIRTIDFSTPYATTRPPSQIILLCPAETPFELTIQSLFDERETIFFRRNSFSSIDSIEDVKCRGDFKPAIKFYQNYQIGFRIYTSDKNLIELLDRRAEPDNFYWYSYLTIDATLSNLWEGSRKIKHVVKAKMHSNDYDMKCDDYTFEQEEWGELDMKELYDENNQREALKRFQISQSFPNEFLVPHQLAPIQDNTNVVTKPGFCTSVNTAPIWKSVAEGPLRKVEEFIRSVADVIGYVAVETGVEGSVYCPTINQKKAWMKVWLGLEESHDSNNITIPEILWKKLRYTSKITDPPQEHYSIVVYVHNLPTDLLEQRKCDHNICTEFGWNFGIENDDKIGLTYCCFDSSPMHKIFNLNQVPVVLKNGTVQTISVVKALNEGDSKQNFSPEPATRNLYD